MISKNLVESDIIRSHIYSIRGVQVLTDNVLSEMYGVETKQINRAVKRNIARFPPDFMFQLTEIEWDDLRCQVGTLKIETQPDVESSIGRGLHRKYLPYVFSEQGVAMLSAVLRSETAIRVSIEIIQAFVKMRKLISDNSEILQRLDKIESSQLKTDEKFEQIFLALEDKTVIPEKGIFFDGQVFDAYSFVSNIIRKALVSIILIDNYLDDSILTLLSKRKKGVLVTIFTKIISTQLALDLEKFNAQYEPITIIELKKSHDRFLILDDKELYHLGASLKDLGKKWFAFSKMDTEVLGLLKKLKEQ